MNNIKHDQVRSSKINAIRKAAGNPMTQCPTCTRSAEAPYRHHEDGKVKAGCIDSFHTGHLYGASLEWHNRPCAQEWRAQELAQLQAPL
jgi:hypothetical protein